MPAGPATNMAENDLDNAALLRLMTWLSPGFPVGGYSYSHGLEFAVEEGLVGDAGTLADWVGSVIIRGAGRIDADLFRLAYAAAARGDAEALAWATERAAVMKSTAETALESSAQGRAFLNTVRAAWPHPELDRWQAELAKAGREPAHAVAVAVSTAHHGIAPVPALSAYLHAFAANLVSAGVRLVPLGQTDGQRVLAGLAAVVEDAVAASLGRDVEDLGSAAPVIDWASVRHETQYTRLFRS